MLKVLGHTRTDVASPHLLSSSASWDAPVAVDRRGLSVAFVIDKYSPFIGGAERQAQLLARLLSARLGHCSVYTAQSGAQADTAAVGLCRLGTSRRDGLQHAVNFVAAFREFLIQGHRYSLVHGHALSALVCGAIMGPKLRGCATLVKVCSAGPQGDVVKLKSHPFGMWLWPMIRRLDVFVVPTPTLVPELLAAGVPPRRIVVIPNALAPDVPEPPSIVSKVDARAELGLPNRPTVLFVGRLSPEKGPDMLMRAWGQVAPECDATLVVVGVGAEAERIAEWARRSGHADRVRLVGARLDVDRFYRAADVVAVPSRTETFSNVLAEAMARGLAVVTTPVGLAAHWIRHAQNGIIVRGESEMAAGLRLLIRDAPLRERLGVVARQDALANFSAGSVVDRYLDLYDRLIAKAVLPAVA